jgi:hypothetical protein
MGVKTGSRVSCNASHADESLAMIEKVDQQNYRAYFSRDDMAFFQLLPGLVLSSNKRAEAYVHGGGGLTLGNLTEGTGEIFGYAAPVDTTVLTAHEFWLQTSGREMFFQLRGVDDIPLREGQRITMVGASQTLGTSEVWVALVNHNARAKFILPSFSQAAEWARDRSPAPETSFFGGVGATTVVCLILAYAVGVPTAFVWLVGSCGLIASVALSVFLSEKKSARTASQQNALYRQLWALCDRCIAEVD